MARIAGVDIPREKRAEVGLTYIYGIGPTRSREILDGTGIDRDLRVKELTESQIKLINDFITEHYDVEGELRNAVSLNIKALKEIGCYRGIRHRKNLPVRGQNTKQNARTRKGRRHGVNRSKKQ